jgi:hypothetical protein
MVKAGTAFKLISTIYILVFSFSCEDEDSMVGEWLCTSASYTDCNGVGNHTKACSSTLTITSTHLNGATYTLSGNKV